jgi:hypothetical protein
MHHYNQLFEFFVFSLINWLREKKVLMTNHMVMFFKIFIMVISNLVLSNFILSNKWYVKNKLFHRLSFLFNFNFDDEYQMTQSNKLINNYNRTYQRSKQASKMRPGPAHDRLLRSSACLCLSIVFVGLACLPAIFIGLPGLACVACMWLYIMIIYDDWIKSKVTFADDTKVL